MQKVKNTCCCNNTDSPRSRSFVRPVEVGYVISAGPKPCDVMGPYIEGNIIFLWLHQPTRVNYLQDKTIKLSFSVVPED